VKDGCLSKDTCTHAYIHTYIQTHTHTYIHTYGLIELVVPNIPPGWVESRFWLGNNSFLCFFLLLEKVIVEEIVFVKNGL
jgi:hypothetical protein